VALSFKFLQDHLFTPPLGALTNPFIIPKANGKLRMCIDYTSLNKACPKDPYPLPHIDQIVDSTSVCDLLSFLDAYSGFHQIQMSREDRKHTAFVTVDGLYYYVVMPYGLKNALPTFVPAMSKTFGGPDQGQSRGIRR
jgi:hypothetical protein